jgi:hypothetical protein
MTLPVADALLSTLAVLKANWDESSRTYLDNFVPFVVDAARQCDGDRIAISQIGAKVRELFGITMPDAAVATVVKKAARQGFGVREHGEFIVDAARAASADLSAARATAVREERALLAKLIAFAREHYEVQLTEEDAEKALLAHVERHAVPLLRMIVRGAEYEGSLIDEQSNSDFIVSSFILSLSQRDPQGFEYLENVVKGSMLASVLYLPVSAEVDKAFQRTSLYFDTPLLLRALGYEGQAAGVAARELLDLAYRTGAKLCCFRHTVDEVRGVLYANAHALSRQGRPNGSARGVEAHFIANKVTPSDVELLLARLDRNIGDLRVQILDRPPPEEALTTDETALEAALDAAVFYPRREALLHDLDSLTAVYRLRRGATPLQLEHARAVFVTSNGPLVGVARRFFYLNARDVWPLAMGDHDLGTLLWLKLPLQAPSLPQRQVIADCLSAMEPGQRLWGLYLREIEKLKADDGITESDYFLLRYTTEAKQALMEKTLGSETYVSPELVEAVLDEAREAIGEPLRKEADDANQKLTDAERQAALAASDIAAMKQSLAELSEAKKAAEERLSATEAAIHARATRRARPFGRLVLAAVALMIVVAGWLSLPSSLGLAPQQLGPLTRTICIAVCVGALVLATAFTISERGPQQVARRLEVAVANRLERRYRRQAGLTSAARSPGDALLAAAGTGTLDA